MAGTSVQVRILSNRLPEFPGLVKLAVSAEVGRAGYRIEARAKQLVPKKTRTLMRSIHTTGPSGQPWTLGDLTALIGPSVKYGRRIEYGFMQADSLGRNYDQPARPYMRPAAEQERSQFKANIARALAGLH